ncbi:UNVERIFIED_CONTAM: hypothetical protein Slati_0728900 [Sesamum latifolium]|uniref:Uncharacterized protein n=1 Tax=Sesamum latifolium TaxID=2727402 RepID=A0AAW2Y672_9LAMI
MEDSSSPSLPTKRAFPPLQMHRYSSNIMMELKNTLFSPTSLIRTPTFRTKRSMVLLYSFGFVFVLSTMVFVLIGHSHTRYSAEWLKNILNRSDLPSYFPRYLFPDNSSRIYDASTRHAETNDSGRVSPGGSALAPSGSYSVYLNATSSTRNGTLAGNVDNNPTVVPSPGLVLFLSRMRRVIMGLQVMETRMLGRRIRRCLEGT